jgi:beta-phosphoglucomutase family hydrolase
MKPKQKDYAVLWDMDGVLVDTGEFHFKAWKETFKELEIPFDREDFKQTFGMNNAGILEWMYGEEPEPEEVSRVSDEKESFFRELIKGKAKLLPGVLKWLEQFKSWGVKQAITSSAPPKNIDVLVTELGIEKYFDAIVTGFDLPGKPNPDIFLKAAGILQIRPEDCIVFEDAIPGVEGAKRAGMKCVAVTTTNPADKLAKADYVCDNLTQMSERELSLLLDQGKQ